MMNKSNIVGIDFGSKLAGTTSICFFNNDLLHFESTKKGQDADTMMLRFLQSSMYKYVFIDSPMSLPLAYFGASYSDFFYRKCDSDLGAMSPMFLGGLTARAMRLKSNLSAQLEFFECYPGALAKMYHLQEQGYKTELIYINKCCQKLAEFQTFKLARKPISWHEFDALLAWVIGLRYLTNQVEKWGDESEGLIYV
jgi:hypothetical protein